jgi:cytochrome P450
MTQLSAFDPRDPRVRFDPYPVYQELRERDPISFVAAARTWFVSTHAQCLAVLSDQRFSARQGQQLRVRSTALPVSMLTTDAQDHARLRGSAADAFGPAAMARARMWMQPMVQHAVRRIFDDLNPGTKTDLVTGLAEPLAVAVLGHFLGLGEEDLSAFASWGRAVSVNLNPFVDPAEDDHASLAMQEMLERFADLMHSPGDPSGALNVLARSHAAGTTSAAEALAAAGLLVVGGLEPLVAFVSNAAAAIVSSPPVGTDCGGRTRTVVDELLRFDAPIQFTARRAITDVELGGRRIAAGDHVVTLLGAANRDPARFANPDRLVLDRRTNPHLAFGAGAHVCLGAPLARLLGELMLKALPHPFPALVIAGKPVRSPAVVPRGYLYLPVRLDQP